MACSFSDNKPSGCGVKNIVYESVCTWCEKSSVPDSDPSLNVVEGPTTLTDEGKECLGSEASPDVVEGPTTQAERGRVGLGSKKSQDVVEWPTTSSESYRYIGESSRTMYERTKEHWIDAGKLKDSSHIARHWAEVHPDSLIPPLFRFRVVRKHTRALTRQVHEAVRINNKGNLNDKLEWKINTIDRLGTKLNKREEEKLRSEDLKNKKERDARLDDLKTLLGSNIPSFALLPNMKGAREKRQKSNTIYFDFRDLLSSKNKSQKRSGEDREAGERDSEGEERQRKKKKKRMSSSNMKSSHDNSGFSGDTTTSWDAAALEEVFQAEENLHLARWEAILKGWCCEMADHGVTGIKNARDAFKHFERRGKEASLLGLEEFSLLEVTQSWGLKFLLKLSEILKGENSVLRGIKRKARGKQNPHANTKKNAKVMLVKIF